MKVTHFGPGGLPVAVGGWSSGIYSLNSNVEIVGGGPQALNFVQRITSNGSNILLNPSVNFAAGSNIALSAASNTITITGSAGGGSGTISAGSNSTRVSENSSAGASSTLWSPFDHRHDGIGTITASSSNTLQRGTFNLRPGGGIAIGLTDTDGDGEFDTATISTTSGGGGGGGAALAQSFIGYNTIGASTIQTVTATAYKKEVTLAKATQFLSIDAYLEGQVDNFGLIAAGIWTDVAGVPTLIIASGSAAPILLTNSTSGFPDPARWFSVPIGAYLDAGTYWIGIWVATNFYNIYYDTGTDITQASTATYMTGAHASIPQTTTTKKFSVRASILS